MTGNAHDAEDVVQEAFLKAYRSLDRFEERSQVAGGLHRIAANCAAAPPSEVTNAKLESQFAASGIAAAVKSVLSSRPGPLWTGWVVPTVGEQAMFWLGQSGDTRALAFFEEVLGR